MLQPLSHPTACFNLSIVKISYYYYIKLILCIIHIHVKSFVLIGGRFRFKIGDCKVQLRLDNSDSELESISIISVSHGGAMAGLYKE